MLRRSALQIISRCTGMTSRSLHTSPIVLQESDETPKVGKSEFIQKWEQRVISGLPAPNFASDWTPKETPSEETEAPKTTEIPKKLTLSFYMPSEIILEKTEVDMALLPAVTGDFGVMPGHVPTMAQLRPGVVSVHTELDKEIKKYFVSGGFAFVHADSSADVCVVEAVEIEHLDKEAIKAGLAEYTAKLGAVQSKGDDYEIAAAQIGVDVYSAMDSAVA